MKEQLNFKLVSSTPYSLAYFVPHSGVAQAVAILEQAVSEVLKNPLTFQMIFLHGPSGTGKTHLVKGFGARAVAEGLSEESVFCVNIDDQERHSGEVIDDEWVAAFIARFEKIRAGGGLVFVSAEQNPSDACDNPHLISRLLSGAVLALSYPREEEFAPLLRSLLERRNLKLSEKSIEYLLRRLPREPLCFDTIFARINELSFRQGKPAGFAVVREVLSVNGEASTAKRSESI